MAAGMLHFVVNNSRLIKDLKRRCTARDTRDLEAFHGLLNHCCRKMTHMGSCVMLSKTLLAPMHFNDNVEHSQAVDLSGKPHCSRVT